MIHNRMPPPQPDEWTDPSYIYAEIRYERKCQDEEWGEQNHDPVYWVGILAEELGEVAKEAIESNLRDTSYQLRVELVHLAAVAVAAIEALDRRIVAEEHP